MACSQNHLSIFVSTVLPCLPTIVHWGPGSGAPAAPVCQRPGRACRAHCPHWHAERKGRVWERLQRGSPQQEQVREWKTEERRLVLNRWLAGSAYLDGYKQSCELGSKHRHRQTFLVLSEAKKKWEVGLCGPQSRNEFAGRCVCETEITALKRSVG